MITCFSESLKKNMRKKYKMKGKTKMKTYDIKLFDGETYTVEPELQLCPVRDLMYGKKKLTGIAIQLYMACLLYTSPSPRDRCKAYRIVRRIYIYKKCRIY